MLDPEKTRERQLLLEKIRQLDVEIAEDLRWLWGYKKYEIARLPLENSLNFTSTNI